MQTLGIVFSILAAISWGAVYVIDQKILETLPVTWLMLLDSLLKIFIIIPFLYFSGESINSLNSYLKVSGYQLVFVGTVISCIAGFFILSSIKYLGATPAAIIEISYPLFAAIFAWIFLGQKYGMQVYLGALLVFLGSYIVVKGIR